MFQLKGSSLGGSVTNLIGGVIIHTYGWSYIFHLSGVLCLVWVILWWLNVYDRPSEHPRISSQELEYLQNHVEMDTSKQKKVSLQTPWLDIFTSVPFLAVSSVFFAMMWFNVTLALQLPTYLDMTHNLNIKMNGYLLSIPDIVKVLVGISFPMFVDNLVKKKKITITFARRFSGTIGMAIPGILLILLAYYGYVSIELTIVLIVLTISISGCGSSSYIANVVDISPNHSGSLMGFLKTISSLPGIISPIIIKHMIADDSANWRSVFLVTSVLVIVSSMIFLFFSSTDIQPWNNKIQMEPVKTSDNEDLLMVKIKTPDKEEHTADNL
ncbi:Major Facilitator Superfamily Transporter 17 [Carabus blaptoides fortunei]